jgi:hypothetical protein
MTISYILWREQHAELNRFQNTVGAIKALELKCFGFVVQMRNIGNVLIILVRKVLGKKSLRRGGTKSVQNGH